MAELVPHPFPALTRRMFRELERNEAIFDLSASRFVSEPGRDLAVRFQGHRPGSPLGPAAGPQTQMAQNIVLSWLGGSRIQELKTVQVDDQLEIPRPCIDMQTVGLNIEWSQELKLEQSLDEYVKGAMLVHMLERGPLPSAPGFEGLVYDLSVGYDLAGIRTERVLDFIHGMQNASDVVERFRATIPPELGHLRELDFPTRLSDTVTLSTFHGCPPDEIEQIIEFLLREVGLHSVIKFNPMLLGPDETRGLLHDTLGYRDFRIPDSAFERDTRWDQAVEMLERLTETADAVGLGLGAKFSNTLIVQNDRGFLSGDVEEAYLSGPPLHVLAMNLVRRLRRRFADRLPISFSAGIDRFNFPDAAAIGLVPITVCSDLLKKGGYGRLQGYYRQLDRRMEAVGATSLDDFILLAYGNAEPALNDLGLHPEDPTLTVCRGALAKGGDFRELIEEDLLERWISATKLLNTETYVGKLNGDERYSRDRNSRLPPKIGSHLELFDCVSCDICVPVCPNDANFTLPSPADRIPVLKVTAVGAEWHWSEGEPLTLRERHQIANYADFCNDCGNCDIFCPEDGGPYKIKPRFFGSETVWRQSSDLDGFFVEPDRILARIDGREYALLSTTDRDTFSGKDFELSFDAADPKGTLSGRASGEVDLTFCFIMRYIRLAVLDSARTNYVNSQAEEKAL
jgi:putative selenate reductase